MFPETPILYTWDDREICIYPGSTADSDIISYYQISLLSFEHFGSESTYKE